MLFPPPAENMSISHLSPYFYFMYCVQTVFWCRCCTLYHTANVRNIKLSE